MLANEFFSVHREERRRSTPDLALRWSARVVGGLIEWGSDPGEPDVSRLVYRVVVRELASGRAIHVEEYSGDEAAARDAHLRLARQIATMEEDAFRTEYGN